MLIITISCLRLFSFLTAERAASRPYKYFMSIDLHFSDVIIEIIDVYDQLACRSAIRTINKLKKLKVSIIVLTFKTNGRVRFYLYATRRGL